MRAGYSALDWDRDVSIDRVRYDGELKLSNLSTFLDFSPLGPFHLTGGLTFNRNRYDVSGDLQGGSLSGNVSGLGVNFYADLGIMFQGSPRASLSANCGALSPAACASLQNEVATEHRHHHRLLNKNQGRTTFSMTAGGEKTWSVPDFGRWC